MQPGLDPFAEIVFSRHAQERCQERRVALATARGEIRSAILGGRFGSAGSGTFRLHDISGERRYLVAQPKRGKQKGALVVVTVLTRMGEFGDDHHLRAGFCSAAA